MKLKLKMFMKILVRTKLFNFSNYLAKSRYCDDSHRLVVGKMKEEMSRTSLSKNLFDLIQRCIRFW